MRRLRRAYVVSAALAAGVIGCELIVSSTVPDFHCTPGVAGACPANMFCDPASLSCVAGNGNEGGFFDVDPRTDADAKPGDDDDDGPAATGIPIGEGCTTGTGAKPCVAGALCGAPSMLTTAVVAANESICTKTCCTSDDCPTGFVCYGAGTGGNYCVSAVRAKRANLGTKKPGTSCTDNGECRSGVCTDDKRCLDTCCKDGECATGTVCRVKSISAPPPARETWVCAPAEADAELLNASGCSGGVGRCKNDNCSGIPAVCRPTCCSNADCVYPGKSLAYCAYGSFPTTQTKAKWCFNDAGGAPVGTTCNGDGECAQRFCDPDYKKCATVCCIDKDCAPDEACQPVASGQPFLRCVKK